MHSLLGYSWTDIAAMLGAASTFFGGICWLIKRGAKVLNNAITAGTYPLRQQSQELTNTIKRLNKNFEEEHEKLQRLEQEVEQHDKAIILHEEKIKRLEERK